MHLLWLAIVCIYKQEQVQLIPQSGVMQPEPIPCTIMIMLGISNVQPHIRSYNVYVVAAYNSDDVTWTSSRHTDI